jgi:peptide deformylase
MLETMREHNGVGLAAEQIGRTEALCVIDVSGGERSGEAAARVAQCGVPMPLIMVNPQIVARHGEQTDREGCLSFPEVFATITRSAEVTVVFTDLDNGQQMVTAHDLLARAIQHEIDHLDGVLLVDRMSPVQKVALSGQLKRLKKGVRR